MRKRATATDESSQPGVGREARLPEASPSAPSPQKADEAAIAHVRRNDDGTWAETQGQEKDCLTEVPYFWAKTLDDGTPGLSVYQHMMNVGRVAQGLADADRSLLELFQLRAQDIGALSALHDIGKISPGFQRKCQLWLDDNGLTVTDRNWGWEKIMEGDHGKVSHAIIQKFLDKQGLSRKISSSLACILGAHHGRLTMPNERGYTPQRAIRENQSGIDWDSSQQSTARRIWEIFGADKEYLHFDEESPAYWWLAGLTAIADWIGSDERYFAPFQGNTALEAGKKASESIEAIGIRLPAIIAGLSFFELFGFQPNDMQHRALEVITGPGVYVIEAPMGMGKTEAALAAAYRLLSSGKAKGIYFALPTQATSNRIHLRMGDFIRRISPDSPSTKLIHGNSWLMDTDSGSTPMITETSGRDWFASAKKALVAPFGVGTVDQALLGVVAAKHFFVRQFALAGKVVILDEVHSYDRYTGRLIERLISTLEHLGCTVIVLSATLTTDRRRQLLSSDTEDEETDATRVPYPLISGKQKGALIPPSAASPPPSREVKIGFINQETARRKAIGLAKEGGAVLWICDTVDSAQETYARLMGLYSDEVEVGLLHSRFPFRRREELEETWMERLGKTGATRCGCVLVSTQIVEQSVDLDADLIISELAPTDMLLQRMGRLWRHRRDGRPNSQAEFFIIQEEAPLSELRRADVKTIRSILGGKAAVYAPYVLLRTLSEWSTLSSITIPDDIRQRIESTYGEMEDEPESWTALYAEWFGTDSARTMQADMSANLWNVALHDEEGVQTRLNDMPTVSLVLCAEERRTGFLFIDGSDTHIEKDRYSLAAARAIHRNVVRVPKYCFSMESAPRDLLSGYLYGEGAVGVVSPDGSVAVDGFKSRYSLRYTNELGLVIAKSTSKELT